MNTYFFHAATLLALGFAIYQLSTIGRFLMSTQEQVDALASQVGKIQTEVVAARDALTAKLVDVQAQLDAAGVTEQVDLSGLQSAVQALDDINPDAPAEVPADAPAEVEGDPVVEDSQDAPPF